MSSRIFALILFCLSPVSAKACFTPEMGAYYFWSELSEAMLEEEFAAKIKIVSFDPTKWETVEFKLADGSTRAGRQMTEWPRIGYEIVDIFRGDVAVTHSAQNLMVTSCNSGMQLAPGEIFFVAGSIDDGKPVLRALSYSTRGSN